MANDPPPDLAHFRSHGLERMLVYCSACDCWRAGTVTFDELIRQGIPETATVFDFRIRLRCARCGNLNPDVRPDWSSVRPRPRSGD